MKGIVPDDILDALKKKKLGLPGIDCEAPEKKNAMMAGEFEVILELLEKYKEGDVGKIAKAQVNILVSLLHFIYIIIQNLKKVRLNIQKMIIIIIPTLIELQVDKLIDLAAPPPKGTGVQNIRECIIQDKMTFDVSADEWQAFLKEKIMNNIERYFGLIVFAMYVR